MLLTKKKETRRLSLNIVSHIILEQTQGPASLTPCYNFLNLGHFRANFLFRSAVRETNKTTAFFKPHSEPWSSARPDSAQSAMP